MGQMKVWIGSEWVAPKNIKTWSGLAWIGDRIGKYWAGSAWQDFISYSDGRVYAIQTESTDYVYELNPDTLAVINTRSGNIGGLFGAGGLKNRAFYVDASSDHGYEINMDTLATLVSFASGYTSPSGIGGTEDRLYTCDMSKQYIYEFNPTTLAKIDYYDLNYTPYGVGGTKATLLVCSTSVAYKLNPLNYAVLFSYDNISSKIKAIGGTSTRIYCTTCYSDTSNYYRELNPDTLVPIKNVKAPGYDSWGIGGTKT
jgi:hypothetical protein